MGIFLGKLVFSGPTGFPKGPAGFSEVFIISAVDYNAAAANLTNIAAARLPLMCPDADLIGSSLSDTAVKGDSFPTGIANSAGTYTTGGATTYNPDIALRQNLFAGALKRAKRFLHMLPKDQLDANGKFAPTAGFTTALTAWQNAVIANATIGTRIKGAVTPPFYSTSSITSITDGGAEKRAIGRPFSPLRGRARPR